jgi:hypothetical protein
MFLKRELVFPLFIHMFPFIMAQFDYSAEAELFFVGRKGSRRQPPGYKRFAQAALAVRFAIEEIRSELLRGATLEVDEERFDCDGIRRLYDSADYPLRRRTVVGAGPER